MVRLIPPLSLRWIFPEQGAPAAPAALVLEDTAIWAWSDNATAIDGNGDAAWKKDGDFRAGSFIYVIQDDTFYAFDLFDGSSKVEYNLRPEMEKKGKKKFDRISTHIAASDTHVWGGDPYGTLWALNRETGRPEWHHRPKGATGYSGSIPAISGSRLYIPSFSMDARFPPSLYCYEQS